MGKTETITSAANPLVQDVKRAIVRGSLTEEGFCAAEGFHLLGEALRSGCEIDAVLVSHSVRPVLEAWRPEVRMLRIVELPDPLLQKMAGTETSQGVIALVRPPVWEMERVFQGRSLVVVLDRVQDPGNTGTIVRAAEAFGVTGVLALQGTAGPYNGKTMRAAAGSLFRVPYVHGLDADRAIATIRRNGVELYAAEPPRAGKHVRSLTDADLTRPCGFAIGSEAHGVSPAIRSAACEIAIPTTGVESLNAAMAAGILLYEAYRQRVLRT